MVVINIILYFSVLFYLLIKKRRIDFLSVYFYSSFVYYFTIIINMLSSLDENSKYYFIQSAALTKFVVLLNGITVFAFILVKDFYLTEKSFAYSTKIKNSKYASSKYDSAVAFLTVLFFILTVISFIKMCPVMISSSFDKQQIMDKTTYLEEWIVIAGYVFSVYYIIDFKKQNIVYAVLSFAILGYSLILMKRSTVVFIAILLIYKIFNSQMKGDSILNYFKKHKYMPIFLVVFVFFVFLGKQLIKGILGLNFEYLGYTIKNCFSIIARNFIYGEGNIVSLNLNTVIENHINVGGETYLNALYSLVPLGESVFGLPKTSNTMNDFIQGVYFKHVTSFGMSGTFLGEAIANVGYIGMFIVLCVLIYSIYILEKKSLSKNKLVSLFSFSIIPLLAFYIHRNSLEFTISYIKNIAYIIILIQIVYLLIEKYKKVKLKKRGAKCRTVFIKTH